MGCIYNDYDGNCQLWDESIERPGCDEKGICVCDEDPDPNVMCEDYESDCKCEECGADLNIEECECDD